MCSIAYLMQSGDLQSMLSGKDISINFRKQLFSNLSYYGYFCSMMFLEQNLPD